MALEGVIYSQDPFLGCYFNDLFPSFGSLNFDPQLVHHHQNEDISCVDECATKVAPPGGDVARRKRRRRSSKNKEEMENQRMTHIAVERNRRKQMNEYLAAIRSLMPPSYVQRGDQASIIGGAINYVKELEQLLQSLEAQKITTSSPKQQQQQEVEEQEPRVDITEPSQGPFSGFFSFPQYSTSRRTQGGSEIEVNMADSHANVKILSKRKPKQLLKLVAGFQALRLAVLHVNVTTTIQDLALYSFSLKVEEGCNLNSVEEIAGAANHILES